MRTSEGIIYILTGMILLFFLPTVCRLQRYDFIKNEKAEQLKMAFLNEIYEDGAISQDSYLATYEEIYMLKNKEIKLELLQLEGQRNAELSDYLYITRDDEIRNGLEEGAFMVPKGCVVYIHE